MKYLYPDSITNVSLNNLLINLIESRELIQRQDNEKLKDVINKVWNGKTDFGECGWEGEIE